MLKNSVIDNTNKKVIRILQYLLGLFCVALGDSIAVKSDLGTAPVSAVPYMVTMIVGIEMGITTTIFQSRLVLIQVMMQKKIFLSEIYSIL